MRRVAQARAAASRGKAGPRALTDAEREALLTIDGAERDAMVRELQQGGVSSRSLDAALGLADWQMSDRFPTYTISEADYTVDNWSVVDKSVTGVNTSKSTSRIQVKIQQCVIKVGCYANNYPTGTIVGKANNTADISTTAR